MFFTDTHTHLYLNAFDEDRDSVVKNAIDQNSKKKITKTNWKK